MTTTVAVVNWNSGGRLRKCLDSLLAGKNTAEILVVDNASDDDSLEGALELRDQVTFIRNSVNRGLASAINQAFASSETPYVLLLNPDVCVGANAISPLEKFLDEHPRSGAIGGWVNEKYLPRKFPTAAALIRENLGIRKRPPRYERKAGAVAVDQPAAAALLVRRDAYDEIGGFDERFFPAWYEDVDFCLRLKTAGWEIYFVPQAEFVHEGGYSAARLGADSFVSAYYGNQVRYVRKHMSGVAAAAVRLSIVVGMIERMVARPGRAGSYAKAILGAVAKW